jgi:hypothetical protein
MHGSSIAQSSLTNTPPKTKKGKYTAVTEAQRHIKNALELHMR